MSNPYPISGTTGIPRSCYRQVHLILISGFAALLLPESIAAQSAVETAEGNSILFFAAYAIGIIGISVVLIFGLTHWGHKQDQILNMMPFCIKSLVESKDENEKIAAARALGEAHDPGALLILTNIADDENASEQLREAASEALQQMGKKVRRYSSVINDCLEAVEAKDHQRLIDLLIKNFEQQKRTYVQSAFLIGREYMRMSRWSDARTWLNYARVRNRKAQVYFNQISQLITVCNERLFNEGDRLFETGKFYDALERYALASHELKLEEKRRYAAHLRLVCTYCKLERYEDAYQETLHALQDQHKTDTSLVLNNLLHQLREETGSGTEVEARRDLLIAEITKHTDKAMEGLIYGL